MTRAKAAVVVAGSLMALGVAATPALAAHDHLHTAAPGKGSAPAEPVTGSSQSQNEGGLSKLLGVLGLNI